LTNVPPDIFEYIRKLKEPPLRRLVDNVLRMRCGHSELSHSSEEYGADVLALITQEKDHLNRSVTILVQVKAKKLNATDLRKDIFGQLVEVFSRKLERYPFDKNQPRRILLISNVKETEHVNNVIDSWNSKIPIPIEYLGLEDISQLIFETIPDLKQIKSATRKEISSITTIPEIQVVGKEKPIIIKKT